MLYIFLVDTGTMYPMEMNLAMDSVSNLRQHIASRLGIPEDKQVLLISGGENLDPDARVCSYSAGTDTNPIFLFSKSTIESATPPSPSVYLGTDLEMREQVEGALQMPPTYGTVVSRAQLALHFHEMARDLCKGCENLVHEQHLQHQGWAAVIANLDDISKSFGARSGVFQQHYRDFLENKDKYNDVIHTFPNQLEELSHTPLLQCLVPSLEGEAGLLTENPRPRTLLEWIKAQDPRGNIEQMVEQAAGAIEQFQSENLEQIMVEVRDILDQVNNPSMKEVKGLEDRLYGLDQLMYGARRVVQEQQDMAQGFVQNQNRASNLRDTSVLPDLCNSHQKQLKVMLKNHQQLREIMRKCTAAKEELSINLHTRLRWIMYVEKTIVDTDNRLIVQHETLRRLKKRMEILNQMYDAPKVYAAAVVEVVRRKKFNARFLEWSSALCENANNLHTQEIARRKEFAVFLSHHFLQTLFPGFQDVPPHFANSLPDPFDLNLPLIVEHDVEILREEMQRYPEITNLLNIPDVHTDIFCQLMERIAFQPGKEKALTQQCLQEQLQFSRHSNSDITVLSDSSPPVPAGQGTGDHQLSLQVEDTHDSEDEMVQVEPDLPSLESGPYQTLPKYIDTEVLPVAVDFERIPQQRNTGEESVEVLGNEDADETLSKRVVDALESDDVLSVTDVVPREEDRAEHAVIEGKAGEDDSDAVRFDLGSEGTDDIEVLTPSPERNSEEREDKATDASPNYKQAIEKLTEDLSHKEKLLLEKTALAEEMVATAESYKAKLLVAEDKLAKLHDIADKAVLKLKCEVLTVDKQVQKNHEDFLEYMKTVSGQLFETVQNFHLHQQTEHEKILENLKCEHEKIVLEYQEKLEVEVTAARDVQQEIETYRTQYNAISEKCDQMTMDFDQKIIDLEKQYKEEKDRLIKDMMLEHELEVEKVHSEMEIAVITKEQEIAEIESEMRKKEELIAQLKLENEKIATNMSQKFQAEKEEIVNILKQEGKAKLEKALQEETAALAQKHSEELEKCVQKHKEELKTALDKCSKDLGEKHRKELESVKADLATQKETELKGMKSELKQKEEENIETIRKELKERHEEEVTALKARYERDREVLINSADFISTERVENESQTDDALSLDTEKYMEIVAHKSALQKVEEENAKKEADAVKQAVDALKTTHQEEISQLVQTFEKNRQDSLASLAKENQVSFNEAVSKVIEEKDKLIEELRKKYASVQAEQEKEQATIQRLMSDKCNLEEEKDKALIQALQREKDARAHSKRLEEELGALQLQPYGAMGQSAMGASVVPISESDSSMHVSRVQDLQTSLKNKDDEISKLKQRLMELSMTGSARGTVQQDKVAITSCNVGDIVLLCLDERHDQYVVFTVGTTLHFLHSDCLDALGLKTVTGDRKSWVLAQVTDKEYCQAKKPNNRFRVPVGTKFYRVKAKPWDREATAGAPREPSSSSSSSPSHVVH
ncbi:RB1-inducible coiled-coil protein 1 isoform X2 [Lingula anatina]|uniref:RB1-inducible coiled-coil protein 1 n=1 Tax=Lingula anatina TaxID=7574 RepID=A0A1S3IPB5_LINAN|nr:RB1-inducible coiled-coil protein 1 isoform X2 [Lingula anatina]|eukprot:XP_013399384.1 RB1-inducible coiled-coil protein 1 isoform X2 [Lingula anatina]